MPIEIRELVIRTVVGDGTGREATAERIGDNRAADGESQATEDIVQECVRQVLRVLSRDKER